MYTSLFNISHEVAHSMLENRVAVCEENYRTRQLRYNLLEHCQDRTECSASLKRTVCCSLKWPWNRKSTCNPWKILKLISTKKIKLAPEWPDQWIWERYTELNHIRAAGIEDLQSFRCGPQIRVTGGHEWDECSLKNLNVRHTYLVNLVRFVFVIFMIFVQYLLICSISGWLSLSSFFGCCDIFFVSSSQS